MRTRRLILALLVALIMAAGCGGPPDEAEPDPHYDTTERGLIDCSERTDTGYMNGTPFQITLITVDGKPAEKDTGDAYWVMQQAAAADGIDLVVTSGFRTMAQQQYLYDCYIHCSCNSCNLAARPGYSNHQSGHALDLNTATAGVYAWMEAHASHFGFARTVPSEEWHWEWWGGGPGGGPCAIKPLDAQFVGQGSDAVPDPEHKAQFRVCRDQAVSFWFEVKNTGSATWSDQTAVGGTFGQNVRLGVPGDQPDPFTGSTRISVGENATAQVHTGETTRFTKNQIRGHAPSTTGIHTTRWRLVDETRSWFGPEMWLSFNVVDCASTVTPPPDVVQPVPGTETHHLPSTAPAPDETAPGSAMTPSRAGAMPAMTASQGCACLRAEGSAEKPALLCLLILGLVMLSARDRASAARDRCRRERRSGRATGDIRTCRAR